MGKKGILLFTTSIFLVNHFSLTLSANVDNSEETIKTEKRFKNHLHELMHAKFIENAQPKKALDIYNELIKTRRYTYKWLIHLLHKTGSHDKIRQMIPLIKTSFAELLKEDPDTGFIIAYSLAKQQIPINQKIVALKYSPKAMDVLIPLVNKFPANQKIASFTATQYELNGEIKNALSISEKYLNISATKPTDYLEYFKNSDRYLRLNNTTKAWESIKKCVEIQPNFIPGLVKSVKLGEQVGKTDDAIKNCIAILELVGPRKCVIANLMRLFFKLRGQQHKTTRFQIDPACYKNAKNLFGQKKYRQALEFLDRCLSTKSPKNIGNKKTIQIRVPS